MKGSLAFVRNLRFDFICFANRAVPRPPLSLPIYFQELFLVTITSVAPRALGRLTSPTAAVQQHEYNRAATHTTAFNRVFTNHRLFLPLCPHFFKVHVHTRVQQRTPCKTFHLDSGQHIQQSPRSTVPSKPQSYSSDRQCYTTYE